MALKSDRYELQTDISFFYNDGAVTRGGVVVHDTTAGSGASMDQGVNLVKYTTVSATNMVTGSPAAGDPAYACTATAGYIRKDAASAAASGALLIGRFLTSKDADGYAKVEVNLP
jgi:hypothetical protein